MTQAILASIVVLLLIAAIVLIVIIVRSGDSGGLSFGASGEAGKPSGTEVMDGTSVEGAAISRRRFIGFFALAATALSVLLARLWSMQVISGEDYTAQAESNSITEYTTPAARGRILDRDGNELVGNRSSFAVLVSADSQDDTQMLRKLATVLGIPYESVCQLAASDTAGAQADRVIMLDADERLVAYLSEHASAFPGVSIESRTVRTYANGNMAAHLLGYTGTISEDELASEEEGTSYESGDTVGKSGAEAAFESYLQGDRGVKQVEVNATGEVVSTVDSVEAVQGNDVALTIDTEVQKQAESALLKGIEAAHELGFNNANAGAVVCLNAKTGEVIAMASYPTYDPEEFIGGISTSTWEEMNDEESGYPLSNRCIAGLYPAASTFKGFTGLAGLEYGYASIYKTWTCKGTWTGFGEEWSQNCWNTSGHGTIDFHSGIVESCDVVFYEIAKSFYQADSEGTDLQDYLESWGFGSQTGIELPGEASGRVPTPEWKADYNADAPENQAWLPGDLSNLIIGQGDLLVTPLQLACGYAGLATGRVPKPVLLHKVYGTDGESVLVDGKVFRGSVVKPKYDEENIQTMRNGFRDVVAEGSVEEVFSGMKVKTSGKTGTGQVAGKDDYGWYVGYGPNSDPTYVCACCIEQGGSGASVAAPVVRSVLGAVFGTGSKFVSGSSTSER